MAVEPLSPAQLAAYLARIGLAEAVRADLPTLDAMVRAHVRAIPFENLDVQLGRPLTTDPAAAFAKLVEARRGGWCYEHNGVLGAALAAIGFDVTRMSAGVMRQMRGDESMGSHLCLLVQCGGQMLVDAGFGSWLGAPVPLEQGAWTHDPLPVSLGRTDDAMWRVSVSLGPTAMSYDFKPEPADEEQLSRLCRWQAHDPASVFVQNLTAQRRDGGRYLMLRGKVMSVITTKGEERREVASATELVEILRDLFLLDVPEAADLWPAIEARHEALFGTQAAPTT
ncbi:arylamine N-acetyltransferase family protein [Novosphingobium jiangmenense]|uniref:Arylamine N-acetyltransferase n=1 Tax=Novosphingobium jiangmenense TaxID=2791981 RepID=A0ABS0HE99_9SPHN|nr:arylamine N-acetyltransferase [Novosphingobium jiangmenense]MBF9150552.1 arylamine N-acetyltransferase [Novosphingobium jiangmenense]